jgi:hypothetical protein
MEAGGRRTENERLMLSMDLCRFAKVGKMPEPQTTGMPCPAWITRADSDKELFVAATK